MDRSGEAPAGGTTSDNNKKRRRNDDASGGRGSDRGGRGNGRNRGRHGRGRGRGGRVNGRGGRGNNSTGGGGGGGGGGHNRNSFASLGRPNRDGNHNHGGRRAPSRNHNRHNDNGQHQHDVPNTTRKTQSIDNALSAPRTNNVVSANSSETSSLANDSDTNVATTATNQQDNDVSKTITILSWPNPHTHYIPIEEEERLLPVLIKWGKSEKGMMKDQPSFRLQKLEKMLENDRSDTPSQNKGKRHNSNSHQNKNDRSAKNHPSNSTTTTTCLITQRISLVQSLSLRRHHLKLLNPKFSMTSLRLGNQEDIRAAADLFEVCVDEYLRNQGVHYWTEEDQRSKFERSMKGVPFYQRKQPPTPDFMMKDGHCVQLSFSSEKDYVIKIDDDDESIHSISINWIEAKMFYGANTIASGTPNAVGCILPKVKDYVSLYGTGAIVFMYGCGSQLAAQLLEVGVVALDGRGLNLDRVEKHQKRWCADSWGNILF